MTSQDDTESVNGTHGTKRSFLLILIIVAGDLFSGADADVHPLWRFSGRAVLPGLLRTPRLGRCGSAAADCVDRLARTAHAGPVASRLEVSACALLRLR